jgi:4-amino-4-deoxy-L-arabinose transferase-like glycosyltransferase
MTQLFASSHIVHTLLFGLPTLAILIAALAERYRHHRGPSQVQHSRTAVVWLLASCSLVAGGVHTSVIAEHFHEYALFGWFFVAAAVAQIGFAALLLRRPGPLLVLGAFLGNAFVVLLWVQTRFFSLPLGPETGSKEEIGSYDIVATANEVLIVALAVYCLVQMREARRRSVAAQPAQRIAPVAQPLGHVGR